jgi:hypothetical protein
MRRGKEHRAPRSRALPGGRPTRCLAAPPYAKRCSRPPSRPDAPRRRKSRDPSNIGNYLAGLGIPATAGFGVAHEGLHGTDEHIRLDSIPVVQAAYHQALLTLLHIT